MADSVIYQRLQQVIVDHLSVEPQQVTPQARFVEDLEMDSLDAMDLLMAVNEEFSINISPEALEQIHTVDDFVNVITKELA